MAERSRAYWLSQKPYPRIPFRQCPDGAVQGHSQLPPLAHPVRLEFRRGGEFRDVVALPIGVARVARLHQTDVVECGSCHQVNGMGMSVSPPLNGLSKRRSRSWVEQHFADPAKLSPGSLPATTRAMRLSFQALCAGRCHVICVRAVILIAER
jgi:hypothetical protein